MKIIAANACDKLSIEEVFDPSFEQTTFTFYVRK